MKTVYPSNITFGELGPVFPGGSQSVIWRGVFSDGPKNVIRRVMFSGLQQILSCPSVEMGTFEETRIIRVSRDDVEQVKKIFEGDEELMRKIMEYVREKAKKQGYPSLDEEIVKAIALASLVVTYKVIITESSNR